MKRFCSFLLAALLLLTVPAASSAAVFSDVKDYHSSAPEIQYLVENGVIAEQAGSKFRINDPITRLEASAMLQRALGLSVDGRPAVDLADVKPSHPHYALIATMIDEGIFRGNEKNEFSPNGKLTRGQMAAVFVRAFELKGKSAYKFRDVPASYWALPDIQTLSVLGITTGFPDNTFKPGQTLTRGHFAVFLARILEPAFKNTPTCFKGNNTAQQVVNVPVTTLWKQPGAKRAVDSFANSKSPDITKWNTTMTLPQKQWLVGKLETQVLYGQAVNVLQTKGDWVQVAIPDQKSPKHASGYPGWMPKQHLTTVYPNYTSCEKMIVKTKSAVLTHDAAGVKPFKTISFNTVLPVVKEEKERYAVQTPADGVKYVNKNAVKMLNDKMPAPNPDQILATAKQFEGLPYLWAGTSGFGFDCSGFTYSVYRQHGISLPRDASVQAVNGAKVLKKDLQPGDLLFFAHNKGKGAVHHVGMYIGNNKMIHAPNPKRSVEIIPMTQEPYQSEYSGARRYLK